MLAPTFSGVLEFASDDVVRYVTLAVVEGLVSCVIFYGVLP